jgi:hypothetical protein
MGNGSQKKPPVGQKTTGGFFPSFSTLLFILQRANAIGVALRTVALDGNVVVLVPVRAAPLVVAA